MSRADKLTKGADIVEVHENESGFNYYVYMRSDGSSVIQREATDGSDYKYAVYPNGIQNTFAEFVSNRASLDYTTPDAFPNL